MDAERRNGRADRGALGAQRMYDFRFWLVIAFVLLTMFFL